MSIEELLSYLTTTAAVIGFIVLTLLLAGFFWLVGVWHNAWKYKQRRKRKHDIEWDNVRSKWLDEHIPIQRYRTDTVEQAAIRQDQLDTTELTINPDRLNTDIMDLTIEQIVTYQKEHDHDAS